MRAGAAARALVTAPGPGILRQYAKVSVKTQSRRPGEHPMTAAASAQLPGRVGPGQVRSRDRGGREAARLPGGIGDRPVRAWLIRRVRRPWQSS